MKLQLLSDLHIEYWSPKTWQPKLRSLVAPREAGVDVLALLGDIHVGKTNVQNVLTELSQHYDLILYVPGNHEYYKHTIHELDDLQLPHNAVMLNPGAYTYKDIRFAGATLWSPLRNNQLEIQHHITDFKIIKGFTVEACQNLNKKHSEFLISEAVLKRVDVVLTHFIPSHSLVHPKWVVDPTARKLNDYFVGNCTPLCKYHLFGHTHDPTDQTIDGTRYIANPYGYAFEFTNNKQVIIDL